MGIIACAAQPIRRDVRQDKLQPQIIRDPPELDADVLLSGWTNPKRLAAIERPEERPGKFAFQKPRLQEFNPERPLALRKVDVTRDGRYVEGTLLEFEPEDHLVPDFEFRTAGLRDPERRPPERHVDYGRRLRPIPGHDVDLEPF